MNEKQLLDIIHVISSCLQAFVVVMALVAFGHVDNKRAWWWFVLASVVVFTRRLTAVYESIFAVNTNILEGIQTISISVMWLIFILIRTDNFKRNPNGANNGPKGIV